MASMIDVMKTLLMFILEKKKIITGAHNEKQTGRGRSAKRPRSRLKFQIFPTVVELLNLDVRTRLHAAPRLCFSL